MIVPKKIKPNFARSDLYMERNSDLHSLKTLKGDYSLEFIGLTTYWKVEAKKQKIEENKEGEAGEGKSHKAKNIQKLLEK